MEKIKTTYYGKKDPHRHVVILVEYSLRWENLAIDMEGTLLVYRI